MRSALFYIALFIFASSYGQRFPYASTSHIGGTGEGVLLYFEDFDDRSIDASLTQAEMLTIFNSCTDPNGNTAIYQVSGDGKEQIYDDNEDSGYPLNHVLLSYYDYPCTGSGCGMQVFMDLREKRGADASLDNHTFLFMSWDTYMEDLDESTPGKMFGGFRIGTWIWPYDPEEDPWPVEEMGMNATMTYNASETLRTQLYWYGMETAYGNSLVWRSSYPEMTGSISIPTSLHNLAIVANLNSPPDTTDGYLEFYYDGRLVSRYDSLSLILDDSLGFDWMLLRNFPGASEATDNDWWTVIDNIALGYWTEGDSTWTGMEWLDYQDSAFYRSFPGMFGSDTTGWGVY